MDGDRLYVTGGDGLVTCHDAANGQILWKRDMLKELGGKVGGWRYAESVLILDNLAIVTPGGKQAVVPFDKTSGEDDWQFAEAWTSKDLNCHPGNYVVVQGRVYGKAKGGLACLDLKTGETLWTERRIPAGQVSWADGRLYVFADSRGVASLVEPTDSAGKLSGRIQVDGEGASWAYPVALSLS